MNAIDCLPIAHGADEFEPFLEPLRADLHRYLVYCRGASLARRIAFMLTVEGAWASLAYRLGRMLRFRALPPVLGGVAWTLQACLELAVRIATGIRLDIEARIEPGLYIGHHGSIYVGPGVHLGRNCSLSQMVYVAAAGLDGASPRIGERVYLGPGSKVLGGVRIGNGAAIGANAVVLNDVPENGVMAGVPARLVKRTGSAELIYLGDGRPPEGGDSLVRCAT
jgi:serine acetyltransferase